jgi:hypothetical protein
MMALCDKAAEIGVIDDADSDPEQTQPSQPSHAPQLMADTDPEQSQPPQPSHAPQLMDKPDLLVTEAADSAPQGALPGWQNNVSQAWPMTQKTVSQAWMMMQMRII